MKRKLIAMAVVGAMIASMAPTFTAQADTRTVAMICDSSISDGGWGMACYNAMMDAAEECGWETMYSDSIAQSSYYDTIVSYCDLGVDMIYAPGNQYTDAILQAAEEYPEIAFALLNGGESTPEKAVNGNVSSLLPDATQIGWIAGALAGLMTESGTIAFIGGMELDTTLAKYAGYGEAASFVAEEHGKSVTLLDPVYSGDFSASDKGLEFAKAMMDQGADVFFGDASAVDSGARQAMKAVEEGEFGGETLYGTLQNGVLSAGALNEEIVPVDVQEEYAAYIQQMEDGTFMS